ncbi:MAG: thermonuclease family protein [Planctomycetaceae bacterium]
MQVDLGLHTFVRTHARLLGINTPEIHGETLAAGERSKRRLAELIDQAGDDLACRTKLDKDDKYGRLLVTLYPHQEAEISFNEILVKEQLAVPFMQ